MTLETFSYYCQRCTSRWFRTQPETHCPYCRAAHPERIDPSSPYWRARLADEEAAA